MCVLPSGKRWSERELERTVLVRHKSHPGETNAPRSLQHLQGCSRCRVPWAPDVFQSLYLP